MIDEVFSAALAPIVAELRAQREEIARLRDALGAHLPQQWITRSAAAEAQDVSVDTIDRMIANGRLESRRIGKRGIRVRLPLPSASGDSVATLAREARAR